MQYILQYKKDGRLVLKQFRQYLQIQVCLFSKNPAVEFKLSETQLFLCILICNRYKTINIAWLWFQNEKEEKVKVKEHNQSPVTIYRQALSSNYFQNDESISCRESEIVNFIIKTALSFEHLFIYLMCHWSTGKNMELRNRQTLLYIKDPSESPYNPCRRIKRCTASETDIKQRYILPPHIGYPSSNRFARWPSQSSHV